MIKKMYFSSIEELNDWIGEAQVDIVSIQYLENDKTYFVYFNERPNYGLKLLFFFSKKTFDLPEDLEIEIDNPPFMHPSRQPIEMNYSTFLGDAGYQIENIIESKQLKPVITSEVWEKKYYKVVYEFY